MVRVSATEAAWIVVGLVLLAGSAAALNVTLGCAPHQLSVLSESDNVTEYTEFEDLTSSQQSSFERALDESTVPVADGEWRGIEYVRYDGTVYQVARVVANCNITGLIAIAGVVGVVLGLGCLLHGSRVIRFRLGGPE